MLRIKSAQKKICLNTPFALTTLNFIPTNALNEQYQTNIRKWPYGILTSMSNKLPR